MAEKGSINITWDKTGHLSHIYSGIRETLPRDDIERWVIAPSAPLFLSHQLGSMKPSHGLIACQRVIDILFYNKYVLMPINSALKSARIDFIYMEGPSLKIQFHPKHGLFANSDSLEEGVRQLLNNYTRHVYSNLDEYTQIVLRVISVAAIGTYFEFLQDKIDRGSVGRGKDRWNISFSTFASGLIDFLSREYSVPEGGRTQDNEKWAREQTDQLEEKKRKLESLRNSLFVQMGLY